MKILGISTGTKNGNNDTMCRIALEEAKKLGAEIEFIHAADWNIEQCSGCVACSRGLVMGKGMICTRKDDFAALYEKMIDADGVLFVDPIFESGATGLFHAMCDRMGPGHDTGLLLGLNEKLIAQGKEPLDMKYFKQKAISFVGIGGSDWAVRTETDHAMLAMSPGWKVVNNEYFSWCKDVILQDDKVEKMKEIGKNLVEAAQDMIDRKLMIFDEDNDKLSYTKSAKGACPHCNGNAFYIHPGTAIAECELCGLKGELKVVDGVMKLEYDPATEYHAHDILSGKALHGQDIFENEGKLMNLHNDPEFKARKQHYTEVIAPTPSPSKAN
mgnify:CR=1 FL=1